MKKPKKQEGLERLINQLEQAKLDGDTKLAKLIQVCIDRIKKGQDKKD
jgi:hypothetical protein